MNHFQSHPHASTYSLVSGVKEHLQTAGGEMTMKPEIRKAPTPRVWFGLRISGFFSPRYRASAAGRVSGFGFRVSWSFCRSGLDVHFDTTDQ